MVEARQNVWRAGHRRDALVDLHSGHLKRDIEVTGAIINGWKQMAVKIIHLDELDKLKLLLDLLLLELDEDDILELELLDELDEHERKANSILVISNPPSSLNSN